MGAGLPWTWAQSSGTPAFQATFPRFVKYQGIDTGVAIFNPAARAATVHLSLTRSDGVPVSGSVTLAVPALGQIAYTGTELFGTEAFDGSLTVTGDIRGLIAHFQTFDAEGTWLDGTGAPESSTTLVFPVLPRSSEGVLEFDLYNPNTRPTGVELKAWGLAGDLLGQATIQVPAGGVRRAMADDAFAQGVNLNSASHITAVAKAANVFSQAQTIAGTSIVAGFSSTSAYGGIVDIATLNAIAPGQVANAGVIPYFRSGPADTSYISVANTESAAADLTLTAVTNSGISLGVRRVSLPANGGYRASIPSAFPALAAAESEGWILVQASGRVAATVLTGGAGQPSLAAIPVIKSPKISCIVPQVVVSENFWTELVIVNPGSTMLGADVVVVLPDGSTAASTQVSLVPGGRISRRVDQIVPEVASISGGYVYLRSSQPFFAGALIGSTDGKVLTSVPAESLSVPFSPPVQTSFAVSGRVTLNDRPAAGFRVVLSGQAGGVTTTSNDGTYFFSGLPAGRYSMTVDQYGFQFFPAQANFEITNESKRQDFVGSTATNTVVVSPSVFRVGSEDTTVTIFGRDFDDGSQAYVGSLRLKTTLVDATQLRAVIPSYLLATASGFDLVVVTEISPSAKRTSQPYALVVYLDRPAVTKITTQGNIIEGSAGTTLVVTGVGFLPGAVLKINDISDEIQINQLTDRQIIAWVPARYFESGGIYPVTVANPYPATAESNIQLLTVYRPAPAVEALSPAFAPARLEAGAGPLTLEILGYGFRQGAVVYLDDQPLATTYCDWDPYCLTVHLYAKVPANLLRQSGFAKVVVKNPDPSLAASEAAFLRIDGLRPTVSSVVPGTGTVLDLPFTYDVPIVVNGTNFGPQTVVRIYNADAAQSPAFITPVVISSTQLYAKITMAHPTAIGEWKVEVANPPPGGGQSETLNFYITEGTFGSNPFLLSMTPEIVAAGGSAFVLTVNGTNLLSGCVVQVSTSQLATTVINDRQVRAEVPAWLLQTPGRLPVTVINPDTGGASNRLFLEVR
jgi:hypothetical protein